MTAMEPHERTEFAPVAIHFMKAASVFESLHHRHEEADEVIAQYTAEKKVFESKHPLAYEEESREEVFLCENAKCFIVKVVGEQKEEGGDAADEFDLPPDVVELSIKNEDFTFLEWKDNKMEKKEKETNCNVVTLACSFKGSKQEVEKKLKRRPYYGFKVVLEADYGEYQGIEILEKIVRDVNWFVCSSGYELIKIAKLAKDTPPTPAKDESAKTEENKKAETTDTPEQKDKQESQNTSLLLLSKLFSGGLEERHFSSLSQEAGEKLQLYR